MNLITFKKTYGTAEACCAHLPLNIWYLAMYLMLRTAKPISAMSLSRQIQYRICWHLLHRLRAMLSSGETLPLAGAARQSRWDTTLILIVALHAGIIEADETSVDGKPGSRQKHRPPLTARGRGTDKPMVFAAVERGGEARTAVVASASAMALDPLMFQWFDRDSVLCTDERATYPWLASKMRRHHTVRYNRRGHDVSDRIARCLIGQHGRLRPRSLLAWRLSSCRPRRTKRVAVDEGLDVYHIT
jgi:hypothetical protein